MEEIKLNKSQQIKFDNLKLTIELVPIPCWWSNVRSNLTSTQWDKLRAGVFKLADNRCEICGGIGTKHPVECHEIWEYDDKMNIQTLKKFISICPLCHQTKHIELTHKLFGRESRDRAYKRFQDINELTNLEAKLFYDYFVQQWRQRSSEQWKLDITLLDNYNIELGKTKFNEIDRKYFAKENKSGFVEKSLKVKKVTTQQIQPDIDYSIDKNDFKCPYCQSKNFIKMRKGSTKSNYECKDCNKKFASIFDTTEKNEYRKHRNVDDF